MKELCRSFKEVLIFSLQNIRTSVENYDRNALCCGVPNWRWVYCSLHAADKCLINPNDYKEPSFHVDGLDDPYIQCDVVLSDKQLIDYLSCVEQRICDYLDSIEDEELYKKPDECEYMRIELILLQVKRLSFRAGMIDGQTLTERENKSFRYLKWQKTLMDDKLTQRRTV